MLEEIFAAAVTVLLTASVIASTVCVVVAAYRFVVGE